MKRNILGRTGLSVSRLGVGLAEIGFELSQGEKKRAADVLNAALDGGINFLDTAACYSISEEWIGRTIPHRRSEYVLATKAGHVTGGYEGEEWTAQTITDSIERSLVRMRTDHLDIVQLHSCDVDVLERGDVIEALQAAKRAGKTRFIGYSGDNEAAAWAIESGYFDTLQTSFNLVDQRARSRLFPQAKAKGMGIIIKRPIGNGAWGAAASPSGYADEYFRRGQVMAERGAVRDAPDNRFLLALGFVLAHDLISTAIVGTQNPDHMRTNLAWVENDLPISAAAVADLQQRFDELDDDWVQLE